MDEQAFLRTILDEPDDDTPRLVFADWLDDHDQADRAAWVRASVRLSHVPYHDPARDAAADAERAAYGRCFPSWCRETPGVFITSERGLLGAGFRSKTAATRLGKAAWVGRAWAEGWLGAVHVDWCDGSVARVAAKWKPPLRDLPLHVEPAPQIDNDGLALWLAVPRLWRLKLPAYAARHPAARGLARRPDLRELEVDGVPAAEDLPAVLDQVGRLASLRRLALDLFDRIGDADLGFLDGLDRLHHLHLRNAQVLTDAGLARLARLPALRTLWVYGTLCVTPEGVAAFRAARPDVHVDWSPIGG